MRYWTISSFVIATLFCDVALGQNVSCDISSEPYPADGAAGVPLNPMLEYPTLLPEDPVEGVGAQLTLEDSSGVQVTLAEHTGAIGGDCPFVFVPTADLSPASQYMVRADGEVIATFTTGEERDDVPPHFDVETPPEGSQFGDSIPFTSSEDLVLLDTGYGASQSFNYVVFTPAEGVLDDEWLINRLNAGDDLLLVAVDRAGNTTDVWIDGYDDGDHSEPSGTSVNGCSVAAAGGPGGGASVLALLAFGTLALARRRR